MGVNGIYGLSGSGLDVESMVKVGMMSKQNEYDKMQQKYTQNEWQKAAYLEMYGEVQTFNNSTLSQYKMSSNMNARSAESSERSVSATATADAPPMSHYVEVGQLASAAYLVGTQSVARANSKDAASTALKDIFFSSISQSGSTITADGISYAASDIAFTFSLSDGTKGTKIISSTNENVFSAQKLNSDNSLSTIDSTTGSHTVSVNSFASSPVLKSSSQPPIYESTTIKEMITNLFKDENDDDFETRINALASGTASTSTAFAITFSENGTSAATVEFSYNDLTNTDTTFVDKLNGTLSNTNLSATVVANSLSITTSNISAIGSESQISFSITDVNLGTATLATSPVISSNGLELTTSTTAKNAFAQLLGWPDSEAALEFINANSTSGQTAFTIFVTDTANSSASSVGITYAELASSTTGSFKTLIQSKLSSADSNLTSATVKINSETGQLEITNGNAGSSSTLTASISLNTIGSSTFKYPTETPEAQTMTNESISAWLTTVTGLDSDTYKKFYNNYTNAGNSSTNTAIQIQISDGTTSHSTTSINLTYKDLLDTDTKIWPRISNALAANSDTDIQATLEDGVITFSNPEYGSSHAISVSLVSSSLITNQAGTHATILSGLTNSSVKLTDSSLLNLTLGSNPSNWHFKAGSNTALYLDIQTSTSGGTTTKNIAYSDLTTSSLLDVLQSKLSGTGVTAEYVADDNDTTQIQIINTSSTVVGTDSYVSLTFRANDTTGTGLNTGGVGTWAYGSTTFTNSSLSFPALSDAQAKTAFLNKYSDTDAFTVTFNDGTSTSTTKITWSQVVEASDVRTLLSNAVKTTGNISVTLGNGTISATNTHVYSNSKVSISMTPVTTSTSEFTYTRTTETTIDGSTTSGTEVGTVPSQTVSASFTALNGSGTIKTNTSITSLTNAFNKSSTGTTSTVTSTTLSSTGTTTELDAEQKATLTTNLNRLFGNSPQSGEYGDDYDYSSATLSSKLAAFFGGDSYDSAAAAAEPPTYGGTASGTSGEVVIDGKTIYLGSNTDYLTNTSSGVTFNDTDLGIAFDFKSTGSGLVGVAEKSDVISVTYQQLLNGYSFNDLVSEINNLGTNIKATYDSVNDKFSLYNKESGAANKISIGIDATTGNDTSDAALTRTAEFFTGLGLRQSENGTLVTDTSGSNFDYNFAAGKTSIASGKNAIAKIDGVDYYDLDTNNVTVNGVTYTFNSATSALMNATDSDGNTITDAYGNAVQVVSTDTATASPATVNVTQDVDKILEKVNSFIDSYNSILSKLYEWYDTKPDSDYKPLTASQKAEMKQEQIDKWEAKAKEGLLYHDQTLGNLINDIRDAVGDRVEGITGSYNNIYALGLSTTGTKGQLTLDEDKLRAALAADPDAVYNVFAKLDGGETNYQLKNKTTGTIIWSTQSSLDGYEQVKDSSGNVVTRTVERSTYNGIAQRLGDVLTKGMKEIRAVSGSSEDVSEDSTLNNLLRELQTKMSNFKVMMAAFEERLYKKYDAMETALALLGSQLNYVTSAFSG